MGYLIGRFKNKKIKYPILLSLFALSILATGPACAEDNFLLWDGESAFSCEYGIPNTTDTFMGGGCFEGHPDPYHQPKILLIGLPSYDKDISGYDEIWFFAKSSLPGKTISFSVQNHSPNAASNLIEGIAVSTSYSLIRIRLEELKNENTVLNMISWLTFGKSSQDHSICIDEAWAVDLENFPDPDAVPIISGMSAQDFGDVAVRGEVSKTIRLSNIGAGQFVVTSVAISGNDAGDFYIDNTPFTIDAGGYHDLTVIFRPSVNSERQASLIFNHNPALNGTVSTIPLKGIGRSPDISAPGCIKFGKAARDKTMARTFTILNTGNEALTITGIEVAPGNFSVSTALPITVPAGESAAVSVSFSPAGTGRITGYLIIYSNDRNSPELVIDLSGEGVAWAGEVYPLCVEVNSITSSAVDISWSAPSGTGYVEIYIGAEPAPDKTDPLPDEVLIAALPAGAAHYRIEGIAPSVDLFLRVKGLPSEGAGVSSGFTHARTSGGPRAVLDTPLREVHMMAPDILMLVLENKHVTSYTDDYSDGIPQDPYNYGRIAEYSGEEWQAGPWAVTRGDGEPVGVTDVYRHSIPVGQPYYSNKLGGGQDNTLIDVDHRIYLVLSEPVGSREILHITGPQVDTSYNPMSGLLEFILPFSDNYLETPVIQVNQIGYSPKAARRYAYISGWLGDGGALSLENFPVYAGVIVEPEDPEVIRYPVLTDLALAERTAYDPDSGTEVNEIDLSSLVLEDDDAYYRIKIPGVGVSWRTQVSEKAVFKAFYVIARGAYHNRWGRDLQPEWTDWSTRPPDHQTVYTTDIDILSNGFFPQDTPKTGARALSGGHHDAGDFDIRLTHTKIPQVLMRAYEINPAAYTDGQLCIPESANSIPDILDEALHNIKGWEELQDWGDDSQGITNFEPEATRQNDGGVRGGVESWRHPNGYYYADEEELDYWTYGRNAAHTARVAGLFAQASRLLYPYNPAKAHELRERAIHAYSYAITNGVTVETRGPAIYASGELYALTGQSLYRQMYEACWERWSPVGWNDLYNYGLFSATYKFFASVPDFYTTAPNLCLMIDYTLGYFAGIEIDATYLSGLNWYFDTNADQAAQDVNNNHAFRNGLQEGWAPDWGMGTGTGNYMARIYGWLQANKYQGNISVPCDNQGYFDAMSLSVDFMLGCNPEGMVYITGLGSRHPEEPLHLDSLAFIKDGKGPIPGIPVFGPVGALSGMSYYDCAEYTFYPHFDAQPVFRRYGDTRTFVNTNETSSFLNAEGAELVGMLLAPGMQPAPDMLPRKALFDTDTVSGSAPLTVNFADSSHGPIETWEWDFGDGSLSKEKNPFHTYVRPGSYTVTLAVTCNGGTSDVVKRDLITVTSPRTVSLTTPGEAGEKGSIICDFGLGNGIWVKTQETGWSLLNTVCAKTITTGDIDGDGVSDIIVDFGSSNGIWASMADGSWRSINGMSAKSMIGADIDGNGIDDLVIDFGPGYGIWCYKNGMEWSLVHLISASSLARADVNGDHADELVIDFGPGYGVWIYKDGAGYMLLNPVSAREITSGINIDNDAEGREDLVIDFGPGYGIWCFRNGAVWTLVNPTSAKHIAVGDIDTADPRNDIIVDFGPGYGIWIYGNDSAWRLLNAISADSIAIGDISGDAADDIVVDFGTNNGIWMYTDNSSWEKVHD